MKMLFDCISPAEEIHLVMQCMYLASTFYLTVNQTQKVFLYEILKDHAVWTNFDFWERTIT